MTLIPSFKKLTATPKMEQSRFAAYLKNPRLVILIILLISLTGIFSFLNIPRVLNPSINIAIVTIVTVLPGAGPDDIESLITIPIETATNGLANAKKATSVSRDSVSVVSIEFESGTDPEKARVDTQSAVDAVTLPTDAQPPRVAKLDFQNQPVWSFTVTTTKDNASLIRFSKELKDRLKQLPQIREITTTGLDETEIQIILKPESIATYGINPQILLGAIKSGVKALPAGAVKTDQNSFILTIDPTITSTENIRNLKLNVLGIIVSLSEVAQVSQRVKPDQAGSFFASNTTPAQKSVNFNIFKTTSAEIEKTASEAENLADKILKENGDRFQIHSDRNSADFIKDQFSELQRDFAITISLVFATLLLFLGLRQAAVSSFSIPLTFFIAFSIMNVTKIEFSFIAFFSLLLSLGLLVDDTIVVISATTTYFRLGKFNPIQTSLLVWRDFLIPIFTTTLTTVWAFIPLLLSAGIIGEFIKPIPIIVSSILLASFFIAMFVTLPIMTIILKPNIPYRVRVFTNIMSLITIVVLFYLVVPKNNLFLLQILVFLLLLFVFVNIKPVLFAKISKLVSRRYNKIDNGFINFEPVTYRYQKIISRILSSASLRKKAIIAVLVFFVFTMSLFPLGLLKNEFFPASDEDYLFVSLELPPGTNLQSTEKETLKILDELRSTEGLIFANANLGTSFDAMGGFSQGGSNNSLISMVLIPHNKRKISSVDIAQSIRNKYSSYETGKVTVTEVTGGPPAGADLQIKLFGPDLDQLDFYAGKIEDYLKSQPGVGDINKSIKPGTSKLTFVPDQTKMVQNNLSLDQVGFWLRTYASGFKADSVKLAGEKQDTDISLRVGPDSQYVQDISKLLLPTPSGNIPLISLGTLKLEPNPTLITRESGKRTLSVAASVEKNFNIQDKNSELLKFADSLNLLADYSFQTGGVNEENQKSVNSILQAMLLSFLLIVVTMVIQFSSFRDAIIVMLVIPLAVSGVFILFALTRTPLSFPALIGVLALFGIVVKNSILLVDKINQNKKSGMELKEAIADASASRIEPIFLTSFATIMGLIPITLSNPLWRGLGGAIIAGLTFSGTIMLIFIPVVYYFMFSPRKK
ncbi:efflux RND transporter permease subunit [Candidatus Daviesbacteria bacterium]|nr:efflux RND transporter permease subunit [Candidatus Daviesbacteria bacterium]